MCGMDNNIKGRIKERHRTLRERRRRRTKRDMWTSNVNDVLGMTITKGGDEDMVTALALQHRNS